LITMGMTVSLHVAGPFCVPRRNFLTRPDSKVFWSIRHLIPHMTRDNRASVPSVIALFCAYIANDDRTPCASSNTREQRRDISAVMLMTPMCACVWDCSPSRMMIHRFLRRERDEGSAFNEAFGHGDETIPEVVWPGSVGRQEPIVVAVGAGGGGTRPHPPNLQRALTRATAAPNGCLVSSSVTSDDRSTVCDS
jgi:hypothetical protein